MIKFSLITVPHTGTHFMKQLFIEAGIMLDLEIVDSPLEDCLTDTYYWHLHTLHEDKTMADRVLADGRKIIVTARDPYLSAFHYLDAADSHDGLWCGQNDKIEELARHWDHLMTIAKKGAFIFDIGCKEEQRQKQATDILEFIGLDCDIKKYISDWKPRNSRDTENKRNYLEHNTLPDFNWRPLEDAVKWYRELPTNNY
jgi:hypothetical protein